MIPDFGGLLWMVIAILEGIVAIVGFSLFVFWFMPAIARTMIRAKWSKCTPTFVQDNMNRVHFNINDAELPEGLFHNKRGFFVTPTPLPKDWKKKQKKEKREWLEKCEKVYLETPILAGLGKAVFFGYDGSPILGNLKTIALASKQASEKAMEMIFQADFKTLREVLEKTDTKTRFSLLAKWSEQKGWLKRGGDTVRLVVIALCVAAVIVVTLAMVYLILNSGGA